MGTKSSKSKIDDNSKCAKYCTLVYGPELSEDSISNDKWTLECTVQVEKSVDHTYFGAIGWKPGGYFGIQQLAKRKKRAIITIEEPNVSLVYASENVKVSTIENEEEESSKTGNTVYAVATMDLDWKEDEKIRFQLEAWHWSETNLWYYQCNVFMDGITHPMATFKYSENSLQPTEFFSLICNCNENKSSKTKRIANFLDPKFNGVPFKTAIFNKSENGYLDSGSGYKNGFRLEMGENFKKIDKIEDSIEDKSATVNVLHSL